MNMVENLDMEEVLNGLMDDSVIVDTWEEEAEFHDPSNINRMWM